MRCLLCEYAKEGSDRDVKSSSCASVICGPMVVSLGRVAGKCVHRPHDAVLCLLDANSIRTVILQAAATFLSSLGSYHRGQSGDPGIFFHNTRHSLHCRLCASEK